MKALCVKQPFASLIAEGIKTIETRTWLRLFERGNDILICASKTIHRDWQEIITPNVREKCEEILKRPKDDILGVALCVAQLRDIEDMKVSDEADACCLYNPAAWSWFLHDIRKIEPFKIRGSLGLFDAGVIVQRRFTELVSEVILKKQISEQQKRDIQLFYNLSLACVTQKEKESIDTLMNFATNLLSTP